MKRPQQGPGEQTVLPSEDAEGGAEILGLPFE